MSRIIIRKLELQDLPGVASLHLQAFPRSALSQLGFEANRRYYEWQLSGPHEHVALAAAGSQAILGYCIGGLSRGALSGFLRLNRGFLAWRVITHPWLLSNPLVKARLSLALKLLSGKKNSKSPAAFDPLSQDTSFGILAIAVAPDQQRSGIGKLLMDEMERIAKERSFPQMHLTVAPDNLPAIAFYEKHGWERVLSGDASAWAGLMVKKLV